MSRGVAQTQGAPQSGTRVPRSKRSIAFSGTRPPVCLALYCGRTLLGWSRALERGDHDVVHVLVKPRFRGQGYGHALVIAVKEMAGQVWGLTRFRCDCALDLRRHSKPEQHLSWCSVRRSVP